MKRIIEGASVDVICEYSRPGNATSVRAPQAEHQEQCRTAKHSQVAETDMVKANERNHARGAAHPVDGPLYRKPSLMANIHALSARRGKASPDERDEAEPRGFGARSEDQLRLIV
ncbi:hypothetical protein SKAU_G00128770 [Synaphobranchus kaupii]|uniref:Uncharacterized protein n=1 Tax=Synaphobranchus kaupii TaxID=118154 RepID=A0A9Q1FPZ8_SYNKA|nr:hypothetical protein SKAU_G00128770 [Synaphobranchus kaupii]